MPGPNSPYRSRELLRSFPARASHKELGMEIKMNEKLIWRLAGIVRDSHHIVFFGGAGVSTESGIPDFRSVDGLYHQHYKYPPEQILSHTFYMKKPEEFFRFYRDKLINPDVLPNKAHKVLAKWEAEGRLKAVVTQNIDGLHQAAGSKKVLELHGSVMRNHCEKCGTPYGVEIVSETAGVPICPKCGGRVKPDVVLYEEGLDMRTVEESVSEIRAADTLIIGGTSLVVYPAAGLVDYFRGKHLVLINKSATHVDSDAELVIADSIGEVLSAADALL